MGGGGEGFRGRGEVWSVKHNMYNIYYTLGLMAIRLEC